MPNPKTIPPYLPIHEGLYRYIVDHRSDAVDPLLDALRTETKRFGAVAKMSVNPEVGSLISILVSAIGARTAVEIGTFTGASSICIARGLASGGRLICFDNEFKYTSIARRYWIKAGIHEKIELRLGNAQELLRHFRPPAPLDFVFIDGDTEGYDSYYEAILPHVRPDGLILFNNMFQGGKIVEPVAKTVPGIRVIAELNQKLGSDHRIQSVLLPIADGLALVRKK